MWPPWITQWDFHNQRPLLPLSHPPCSAPWLCNLKLIVLTKWRMRPYLTFISRWDFLPWTSSFSIIHVFFSSCLSEQWELHGLRRSLPTFSSTSNTLRTPPTSKALSRYTTCTTSHTPSTVQFHLHFEPYKLFWQPNVATEPVQVHGELYTSEAFIEAYNKLQESPPELECDLPRVVISLMFASDSTQLTSFSTAELWPIYLTIENKSKDWRSKPSCHAFEHVAYLEMACETSFVEYYIKLMSSGTDSFLMPLWPSQQMLVARDLALHLWAIVVEKSIISSGQSSSTMIFWKHTAIEWRSSVVTILLTLNHDHISFTHRSNLIALNSSYMTHLLRSQSAWLWSFPFWTISPTITQLYCGLTHFRLHCLPIDLVCAPDPLVYKPYCTNCIL